MQQINKSVGVGVGTFIFKKLSRTILVSKRLGKTGTNLYALPGGSVELYEEIWQTAIREIKEETNIDISEDNVIVMDYFNVIRKDKNYHDIDFHTLSFVDENCQAINTEPHKHTDWEWMNEDHVQQLYEKDQLFYGLIDKIKSTQGSVKILFDKFQELEKTMKK